MTTHEQTRIMDQIQPELIPGEQVLWIGKPGKHPYLIASLWMFVFGLIWVTMVGFGFLAAILSIRSPEAEAGAPALLPFSFVIVVFALIGGVIVFRSFRDLFGAKKLIYVLTNRRGLIIDRYLCKRTLSIGADSLNFMQRDDRGSLSTFIFGHFTRRQDFSPQSLMMGTLSPIFFHIKDGAQLESLLVQTFFRPHSN